MKLAIPIIVSAALISTGCATFTAKHADFSRPDDPITVLGAYPALAPLRAAALFTPAAASAVFDVIDGDDKGCAVTMKRSPTTRFNAAWAESEEDTRTEFFRMTEEGNVLLTAAIDHDERAISLFDPPLTAVYATLKPGEPLVQEVRMRIMDLRNPSRQREAGTATQTIEHLGRRRIRTEQGEFTVDCISVKFDANLRFARARRDSILYIMDGVGLIAAEHEERVTALGLFNRTSRQTLLRRDLAVAAADKP